MVALVVKRREPLKVFHGYLEILSQRLGLSTKHIPPAGAVVEAQPLRILPPQRYYNGIHVAAVAVEVGGHLIQIDLHTLVREQPMGTEPLGAGAGSYVVRIGLGVQILAGVVLYGAGDELAGRVHCLVLEVVLVLEHLAAVR